MGRDLQNKAKIANAYSRLKDKLIEILSNFALIWDGHLGQTNIGRHGIVLSQTDAKPVYSALFRAGPEAREFQKNEIDNLLSAEAIDPAQTEWDASTMLAQRKDSSVCFCVFYRVLTAVMKR